MKTLYIILSFLLLQPEVNAQIQSNCSGPALLYSSYKKDIAAMAVQRMYTLQSPDTILIDIPQAYTDTIFNGLSAILNLGAAIDADSVFMRYCIHTYQSDYYSNDIEVYVNPNSPLAIAWANMNMNTGNGALDSFVARYGYKVTGHWYTSYFSKVYLHTDSVVNTMAVFDSLKKFNDIYDAGIAAKAGDGDHISYTRDSNLHFIFYMGWGDCPSGCTFYKKWYYTVTNDCIVTLDRTQQSSLLNGWRQPSNCNLFPLSVGQKQLTPTATIFPNPINNLLQITATGEYTYSLYDALGRKVLSGGFYDKIKMDVSFLPAGIYHMQLSNSSGSISKKIVKQ